MKVDSTLCAVASLHSLHHFTISMWGRNTSMLTTVSFGVLQLGQNCPPLGSSKQSIILQVYSVHHWNGMMKRVGAQVQC